MPKEKKPIGLADLKKDGDLAAIIEELLPAVELEYFSSELFATQSQLKRSSDLFMFQRLKQALANAL